MKTNRPICLLGGHLSPAQAVAETIKSTYPGVSICYIARKQAFLNAQYDAIESKVMEKFGRVIVINPPRQLYPWNWPSFFISFFQLLVEFLRNRPQVIVSFGSYVSVPGVLLAALLRIPLVIHEQTRRISRSNEFACNFAKLLCINDKDVDTARVTIPVKITGFPLRPSLFEKGLGSPYPIAAGIPIIVVTGGTTGAVSLNELVFPLIESLVQQFVIVHLTGNISYKKAQEIKDSLPLTVKERYIISPFSNSSTMSWLYRNCTLAISRSGANTIYELKAFHLPAILIPLPWSQDNEQEYLAQWLAKQQKSLVLHQNKLSSKELYKYIEDCVTTMTQKNEESMEDALKGSRALTLEIIKFVHL